MRVPHNSFVVVADGKKSLFFRNEGDGDFLNLIVEHKDGHADLEDRELKSDAPGRGHSSAGTARSAYEETDYHQLEEDKFAAETANLLRQRAIRNDVVLRDEVSRLGLMRGTLSWASSGPDTGRPGYTFGSTPQPHNEGDFTALGHVVRGIDVVDRLELGDRITSAKMKHLPTNTRQPGRER